MIIFKLLSTSERSNLIPLLVFCRRSALLVWLLINELVEFSATADALMNATPAVSETRVSVNPKPLVLRNDFLEVDPFIVVSLQRAWVE